MASPEGNKKVLTSRLLDTKTKKRNNFVSLSSSLCVVQQKIYFNDSSEQRGRPWLAFSLLLLFFIHLFLSNDDGLICFYIYCLLNVVLRAPRLSVSKFDTNGSSQKEENSRTGHAHHVRRLTVKCRSIDGQLSSIDRHTKWKWDSIFFFFLKFGSNPFPFTNCQQRNEPLTVCPAVFGHVFLRLKHSNWWFQVKPVFFFAFVSGRKKNAVIF